MRKFKTTPPSKFEKALAFVSPRLASARYRNRLQFEAASYYSGSISRRPTKDWRVSQGYDPDSDMWSELATMRDRSRDLIRNNPLACGAIKTKVTSIVGSGLLFQARVDGESLGLSSVDADELNNNIEREFNAYFESPNCDIERASTFGRLQALAFRSQLENGDVFVLLPYLLRGDDVYGTKIQLIEADRVSNADDAQNSDTLFNGIEFDQTTGEPRMYHIAKTYPNKIHSSMAMGWDKISAYGELSGRKNVLHLFNKGRVGQHRGLPDLSPVIEYFKQLGNYTDAEVMAAVVSSMFTVFIKSDNPDLNPLAPQSPVEEIGGKVGDADYKLGVGAMLDLGQNEEVTFADPSRPNTSFDNFVVAILRQIGVGLELPFEVLVKHFTASYSASRAAMVIAYQYFVSARLLFIDDFCMPVYREWFNEAVLKGRIIAPLWDDPVMQRAYLNSEWVGPAMPQIDEGREVDASLKRIDGNLSTLSTEIAKHGGRDWQGVLKQRAKEQAFLKTLGMNTPVVDMPFNDPIDDKPEDETDDE